LLAGTLTGAWARRCTGQTLRALGKAAGGIDYTVVSMAIRRFAQRLGKEEALRQMTEGILAET
jgi:chromosomal replication initiation ATPase DnaA